MILEGPVLKLQNKTKISLKFGRFKFKFLFSNKRRYVDSPLDAAAQQKRMTNIVQQCSKPRP